MEHFGLTLKKSKYSFHINKEEFAPISTKPSLRMFDGLAKRNAYTDSTGTEYRKEWCEEYRKLCLQNYDLNMKYFHSLDKESFNDALNTYLKTNTGFCEVHDLKEYEDVSGYYMMVLDEYKQVYIGKTDNICRRIRQHWTKTKSLDRTLAPMYAVNKSVFSIDFFRALDTTRIYVWKRDLGIQVERDLIASFPGEYQTNRIGGDIETLIGALATRNTRDLNK